MDTVVVLVILLVMYIVPEILKRFKTKKPYQYPEFPATGPEAGKGTSGIPGELSRGVRPPPLPVAGGEGTPGDEGDPAWVLQAATPVAEPHLSVFRAEGTFPDPAGAAAGIVWAEILRPPVALRIRGRGMRRI